MKHIGALIFTTILALGYAQDQKQVTINQGPVNGYRIPGLDVFAFYGIPYATAPSGPEKFKAPLPPPVWSEPLEAIEQEILCPQHRVDLLPFEHREDCLIANVYVPETEATNLPVAVFVHGGGFQMGFSNWDQPKQLVNIEKNIIAVTFNYRLGPHGFLCLGTEDMPGNAGFKDQVTLLRWVRDNIAHFGGNPEDVTIVGCSAGGASVDLLSISKMARGLFTKVIGQSGANVGVFAVQRDPIENARDYAAKLNYDGPDNRKDLEEFYKKLSYEELMSVSYNENTDVDVRFSACLESDLGFERFLDENPVDILKNGDYVRHPLLYGYSAMEGLYRIQNFEDWKVGMNEDFSQFLPFDLQFESEEQKQEIANQIKEFYFGDEPVTGETIQEYIDYNSDVMFVVAMHRAVSLQVRAGNNAIYLQAYAFTDDNTPVIPYINSRGASHCDQYQAVMDQDVTKITPEFAEMVATMRALYLNFILTGNPTPEGQTPSSMPQWEPAGEDRSPCMHFGSTIELIGPYEEHRQKFWDDIYDRFHRAPVAPYDF